MHFGQQPSAHLHFLPPEGSLLTFIWEALTGMLHGEMRQLMIWAQVSREALLDQPRHLQLRRLWPGLLHVPFYPFVCRSSHVASEKEKPQRQRLLVPTSLPQHLVPTLPFPPTSEAQGGSVAGYLIGACHPAPRWISLADANYPWVPLTQAA